MFLNYLALALLLLGVTSLIYVLIFLHDIPHMIAKKRNHPQAEAIHVACWLSLFTLHALWPLVFIWAVSKPAKLAVEVHPPEEAARDELEAQVRQLQLNLQQLQSELQVLKSEKEA